jgi:hypothetical protein
MAFSGTIGPSANLIPATIIRNIKGEFGASYDSAGRIAFTSASGQVYTPDRVDTLFVIIETAGNVPPLGPLVVGSTNIANADAGALVTAVPAANQHGLPTNFGPGRGRWASDTGQQRIRCSVFEELNVVSVANGIGSVSIISGSAGNNATVICRNFHGEQLSSLTLMLECVHSVQN